jgi:hypothetical protein
LTLHVDIDISLEPLFAGDLFSFGYIFVDL